MSRSLWSCASKNGAPVDDDHIPMDEYRPRQPGPQSPSSPTTSTATKEESCHGPDSLLHYILCSSSSRSAAAAAAGAARRRATPDAAGSTSSYVGHSSAVSEYFRRVQRRPLAILPCAVRQADPSPPAGYERRSGAGGSSVALDANDDPGDGGSVRQNSTRGKVGGSTVSEWNSNPNRAVESLHDRYSIFSVLGKGTFGRILLAECRDTGTRVALKELPKASTKLADFLREFNYGRQMTSSSTTSGHPCIVSTLGDAFETPTSYVFAQELAPGGDLLAAVAPPNRGGLGQTRTKRVARQIGSALAFLHERRIVHRDVKPENILVYDGPPPSCRRVKLADFGVARRSGTVVCRLCPGTAYTAPEVAGRDTGRTYRVDPATDVWAFGVVLFAVITGNFPWRLARVDTEDRLFADFVDWQLERRRLRRQQRRRRRGRRQKPIDGPSSEDDDDDCDSGVNSVGRRRRSLSSDGTTTVRKYVDDGVNDQRRDVDIDVDDMDDVDSVFGRMLPEPWNKFAEPFCELIHRLLEIDPSRREPIGVVERFLGADLPWLNAERRGPAVVRRHRSSRVPSESAASSTITESTTAATAVAAHEGGTIARRKVASTGHHRRSQQVSGRGDTQDNRSGQGLAAPSSTATATAALIENGHQRGRNTATGNSTWRRLVDDVGNIVLIEEEPDNNNRNQGPEIEMNEEQRRRSTTRSMDIDDVIVAPGDRKSGTSSSAAERKVTEWLFGGGGGENGGGHRQQQTQIPTTASVI